MLGTLELATRLRDHLGAKAGRVTTGLRRGLQQLAGRLVAAGSYRLGRQPPVRRALLQLAIELLIAAEHALGRSYRLGRNGPIRLNLGSGSKLKPGWVNADLVPGADLPIDLRRRFPLPDGCAEIAYAEHVLEHLEYPGEALSFLRECRRVLVPGGVMSISVPTAEVPVREYAERGDWYARMKVEDWHPKTLTTAMEHLNYLFRQDGEHKFAYDSETLRLLLERAGFEAVREREHQPGLDSEERRGSLYAEALRPSEP